MANKARMAKMFLPVAAVVALATACPNGDATPGQVAEAMTNAGLNEEEARCIGDRFDRAFTQEELNEIAGANDPADIPTDLAEEVESSLDDCLGGAGGDATGEDGGDDTGNAETSDADTGNAETSDAENGTGDGDADDTEG